MLIQHYKIKSFESNSLYPVDRAVKMHKFIYLRLFQ